MKTYTVRRYTFTSEELLGANPFLEASGIAKEGVEFKAIAFNEAKQQYELDQLNPEDRTARQAEIDRFRRKMAS